MRHKQVQKRDIQPDRVYQSKLVAKCINQLMRDGKKTVAQTIFYNALSLLATKNQEPLTTFEKAIQNIGPKVEVRPRRVGGASYQIPVEVKGERKISLAIRWLIAAAKSRSSKEYPTFAQKLSVEILDASQNSGEAIKKRDVVHRMAEANKAFAHFRW